MIVRITDVQPNYKVAVRSESSSSEALFIRKSSMRGGPKAWADIRLGDQVEIIMRVCAGRAIVGDAVKVHGST